MIWLEVDFKHANSPRTPTLIPTVVPGNGVTIINYDYDPLYRLTAADYYYTNEFYHYTYDAVGNRKTEDSLINGVSATVNYDYDAANRLTSAGGVNYTFDANGNLLNDGVNVYTYDSANRLTSINGTSSYSYNGLGDRLSQSVDGQVTNYTLDLNTGLTQVLDDGTNVYTYGLGRISQTSTTTEYFLGDALGSVRQLTNSTGELTYAKSYDPYGVVTQVSGQGGSAYGYTGEQQDSYIKLIYLRSRMYSPVTGRFTSKDSWLGDYNRPLSLNRWNYTEGNPINATDPSGHITEKESKRAELILEKLNNIYSIQIEKDWGYLNDLFYVDPLLRTWSDCQWVDGHWRSLRELELTLEAVKDLAKVLGPQKGLFNTSIRWQPVRLYRISSEHITIGDDNFGGYSLNNIILPNWPFDGTDMRAKGTVVHELAHVIDYRQWWPPFKLSNGMAALTKSFKDGVYDPTGEAAPSDYAQTHPREDWAESFKYFVYPSFGSLGPIRTGYIKDVIWDFKTP